MQKKFTLLLFAATLSSAQEIFTTEDIFGYLNDNNPHIILARQQELVDRQSALYAQGAFDIKAHAKAENKEFAISKAAYEQAGLSKKLYNGIELKTDYRRAKGTQEYNNIKTSADGELLMGIKVPLIELLMQSNKDRLYADLSNLEADKSALGSLQKQQQILYETFSVYYQLLGAKILLETEETFLEHLHKQKNFIATKIKEGLFAPITLIEQDSVILDAQKRVVLAREKYENRLATFLYYLNTTRKKFFEKYILPTFNKKETTIPTLQDALETAKVNRPDLKILQLRKKQLLEQKQNIKLMQYPTLNLGAVGNYDFVYKEGYKLSLDLSYAIGQKKAEAKNAQIHTKLLALGSEWKQKLSYIKTDLSKILNSLSSIKTRLHYTAEKVALLQKIKEAEEKRFALGSSNLMTLNTREMNLLQAQKELHQHRIEMQLLQESYKLKTFVINK